jgi:hypothetical protein
MFEFHPDKPGTPAQQETIRGGIENFGYGTKRWRLIWLLATAFKKKQDEITGGLAGSRHHATVSIDGTTGYSFAVALVVPDFTGNDLWFSFLHEVAHLYDRYVMDPVRRAQLMDSIKDVNLHAAAGNWLGVSTDYFNQPDEIFCWSFMRLLVPEMPELPYGYTREVLQDVLPSADRAWVDAGFEILDE